MFSHPKSSYRSGSAVFLSPPVVPSSDPQVLLNVREDLLLHLQHRAFYQRQMGSNSSTTSGYCLQVVTCVIKRQAGEACEPVFLLISILQPCLSALWQIVARKLNFHNLALSVLKDFSHEHFVFRSSILTHSGNI